MFNVSRIGIIQGAVGLFAVVLVGRAAQVQLWQGRQWAARAERQHLKETPLPAPRGAVLDASGERLVESRELVTLAVNPREVRSKDSRALARALAQAGVPKNWVRRSLDRKRGWVQIPGAYLPSDVAPARVIRGVHISPTVQRVSIASEGMRRVIGRVAPDGTPVDGLERALDPVLRGERGYAGAVRDARGGSFESPMAPGVAPRPGHSVVLTLSAALQDICERALADAVANMGASGGDVVFLDPHSGAVLAMAAWRDGRPAPAPTALTEPFEPGSTAKPFIAARLLDLRRAEPDEVINTFNGVLTIEKRTIHDTHGAPQMSLREVISKSSNVGIALFAQRLSPGEQYEALRDAGFGTTTGVPYPAEAPGTLRLPRYWSKQSPASLAMGYEMAVTPLQLAAAYGAIANGGELLEPALVREIRAPDGTVRYRHERRVVRRVMSPEVAAAVREMLTETVERGTAIEADLATFAVAGKTGTARRTDGAAGYKAQSYTATFVGLFPAQQPQYVILVKIDNPSVAANAYYGGRTAAPVSKVVLEAALAARDAAIDRGRLAGLRKPRPAPAPGTLAAADTVIAPRDDAELAYAAGADSAAESAADAAEGPPTEPEPAAPPVRVVPLGGPVKPPAAVASTPRPVPDVRAMPLRSAVYALHQAGFRVQLVAGRGAATWPAAGAVAPAGSVVRLARGW